MMMATMVNAQISKDFQGNYSLDRDKNLLISNWSKNSNSNQTVTTTQTIITRTGVSKDEFKSLEEIDKMMKEAEANKEADAKRKEEAEIRNDAEQMVFATEKTLKDFGDKVKDKEKEEIEELVKNTKDALEKETGKKVVSSKNAKELRNEKTQQLLS